MRIDDGGSPIPVQPPAPQPAKAPTAVAKAATFTSVVKVKKAAQSVVDQVAGGKSVSQIARERGLTYDAVLAQLRDGGYEIKTTTPGSENGVATVEIRDPVTGKVVAEHDYLSNGDHYISVTDSSGKQTASPVRDGQGRKVTTTYDSKTGATTTRTEDDLGSGTVTEQTNFPNGTVVTKTTTSDGGITTVVAAADGSKTALTPTQDPTSHGVQSIVHDLTGGKSIGQIAQERGLTYDQVLAQLRAAGLDVTTTTPATENGVATVEIRDPVTGKIVTEHDYASNGNHYVSLTGASGQETNLPVRDSQGRKVTTTYDTKTGATTTTYVNDLGDGSVVKETQLPSGVTVVTTTDKSGKSQTVVTGKDGKPTTLAADQVPTRQGTQSVIQDIASGKTVDQIAAEHHWTRDQVLAQLAAAGVELKTTAPRSDNGDVAGTEVIDQHSGKVIAGYYSDLQHGSQTTDYTDANGSHVHQTTNADGSSSETVTEANGRTTQKTKTPDGKTTTNVTYNGYTLTTAPDGSKTLTDQTTGTTIKIKPGSVDDTFAGLLTSVDPHSSDPTKAKQAQIIIALASNIFAGEALPDAIKAADAADADLNALITKYGQPQPAQPKADDHNNMVDPIGDPPSGNAPSGGKWVPMEMGGSWYWADPKVAQAYVSDQVAQAHLALLEGKAAQNQAQLDVDALDPSYHDAMAGARSVVNKALAPYHLEWNPAKPKGTLAQANDRLTAVNGFVQKVGEALGDYQAAANLLDTAIAQNNNLKPVLDPNVPAFTNPGTNRQLEYKQGLAAHAQVESLFAQIGKDMASGDQAGIDATIALSGPTADAPPKGTLPDGVQPIEITVGGRTIKVAPDVAKNYQNDGIKALTADGVKAIGVEIDVTNPDGTTSKQWRWLDPKLALQKISADSQVEFAGAYSDFATAHAAFADVDAQSQALQTQLVANYNRTRGFSEPGKEYWTNGGDYRGKVTGQRVEVRKDGQLWIITTFEHGKQEEQLTFNPNDKNIGEKYRHDPLNLQWQALWQPDQTNQNTCSVLGRYPSLDGAQTQADLTLKTVWKNQLDAQIAGFKPELTALRNQFNAALTKYGAGSADVPKGTLPDGVQPVEITVGGQKIKVAPDVAKAYQQGGGLAALTSGGKAVGINLTITDPNGSTHTEWRWVDPNVAVLQIQINYAEDALVATQKLRQWVQENATHDQLILSEPQLLGVTDPSVDKTLLDDHQQQALDGIYQGQFQYLQAHGYNETFKTLSGSSLDDTVAATLGLSGNDDAIKKVTDEIHDAGGDNPQVRLVPIFYVDDTGGSQQVALFAVKDKNDPNKVWYVDATGRKFKDLKELQDNNDQFSEHGELVVPVNLDMTPRSDGTIALQVVKARNVSAWDRVVDPIMGGITTVATIASFIPPLTPFALPVAMAGGLYFAGRAGIKEHDYLETGGEFGDTESLMNVGQIALGVLPEFSGGLRWVGMARALNMTKGETFLAAFGVARSSGSINAVGDVGGFRQVWYSLPHSKQFGDYLATAGGLNTAAHYVDAVSMGIGAAETGKSTVDVVEHSDDMSSFDFLQAVVNDAVGVKGTVDGARNFVRYDGGPRTTSMRFTDANGGRVNAMVVGDRPTSPDKVYVPSGDVGSLRADDPALAGYTHILVRNPETGEAVVVPFNWRMPTPAKPIVVVNNLASSSPYANLPGRVDPANYTYSSGKDTGLSSDVTPGTADDAGLATQPLVDPSTVRPGMGWAPVRPADLNYLPNGTVTVGGQTVDASALELPVTADAFLAVMRGDDIPDVDQLARDIGDTRDDTGNPIYRPGQDVVIYVCSAGTRNIAEPSMEPGASLYISFARQLSDRLGSRVHAVDGDVTLGEPITLDGRAVTELPGLPLVDVSANARIPQANYDAQRRFWLQDGGGEKQIDSPFADVSLTYGAQVGGEPIDPLHLGAGGRPTSSSSDPFAWAAIGIGAPPEGELSLFRVPDLEVLNRESDHGALEPKYYVHAVRFNNPAATLDHGTVLRSAQVNDQGQIKWNPGKRPIPLRHNVHFVVTDLTARDLQAQMQSAAPPLYAVYDRAAGWIQHNEIADLRTAGTLDTIFPQPSGRTQSVKWLPDPPAGQEWLYRSSDLPALEQASDKGVLPPGQHVHLVRFDNPTATLDHGQVLHSGRVNQHGQVEWDPGSSSIPLDSDTHFVVTALDAPALQAQMTPKNAPQYAVYDDAAGWIPHDDIASTAKSGKINSIFPQRSGSSPWLPTPRAPLSGANDRVYPPALWETAQARIFQGYLRSDNLLHVYVVAAPNNPKAGDTLSLNPSNIHAHAVVRPGAWDVEWQFGHSQGKDTLRQFGDPSADNIWGFVVSNSSLFDVQQAGGLGDVPWHLDPKAIPGPVGGIEYQEPTLGRGGAWRRPRQQHELVLEQFTPVRIARGISDKWKQVRGQTWRAETGWVPADAPQSRNAYSLPRGSIAQVGKAAIPMDDSASGLAVVDAHNHNDSFPQPYYLELASYVNRVRRVVDGPSAGRKAGDPRDGLINSKSDDVRLAFTAQPLPYSTRRGGAWINYTELDTATVYVERGWANDWGNLSQHAELDPQSQQMVIPAITGIELFQMPGRTPEEAGRAAKEHIAKLLIWHPNTYVTAGEFTIFAKELWRNLVGRQGWNTLGRPVLPNEVGDLAATHYETIRNVLEAPRDAGLVTTLHDDASFTEFGMDGRPVAAPGDDRYFFQLNKLLMELGSYDLGNRKLSDPAFTLSDSEIQQIVSKGPTRRPLYVNAAHYRVGNLSRIGPGHIEFLQSTLTHPLLSHVDSDSSWQPSIEGTLLDEAHHVWGPRYQGRPQYNGAFLDLMKTGRVNYGGDNLNFQSFGQFAAPWYQMQPALRALEKYDPAMMRWFAGDSYRAKFEASKPVQDWYRYKMARGGGGDPKIARTMREEVAKLPAKEAQEWRDWVAKYEGMLLRNYGIDIRDEATYQQQLNIDETTGRVPGQTARVAPPSSALALPAYDAITIRDPSIQQAVYEQFELGQQPTTSVDDLMGRSRIPLLHTSQPSRTSASPSPASAMPSAADLERFMLDPALPHDQLVGLHRPEDGAPYTNEAIEAADQARQVGANKGLQLWIMAKTEVTARTAAEVGARLESKGRKSAREIYLKTAATFAGLAGAGGLGLAPQFRSFFEESNAAKPLLLLLAGAVTVRGGVEIATAISKELTRKTTESHNEQRVARLTWSEWLINRFVTHGPRTGLGRERFRGPDSVEDVGREWISILSNLMETPIDLSNGEVNDMRSMLIQSEHGSGIPKLARRIGAAQGAIEPFNYRHPTGRIFAWAATLGYEGGFLTAVGDIADHPDHIYSYGLALGTFLYANYRALAAISARHGVDWTARPWPTKIMSIGTNATVATSSGMFAISEFADGKPLQGIFLSGVAYALGQMTRSGIRSEVAKENPQLKTNPRSSLPGWRKAWDWAFFPGQPGPTGVAKPGWVPKHRMLLGTALIGLGVMYFLKFLEDDKKKQKGSGSTPTTPTPSPSTRNDINWPILPSPTSSQTPSPAPSQTQSPTATPTSSSTFPTQRHGRTPPP